MTNDLVVSKIAKAIFEDELKCQEVITKNPTDSWMNGRLVGLMRARDIVLSFGDS